MKNWFVYMILTRCGKIYTGITTDLQGRFLAHQETFNGNPSAKGAKFFRAHEPERIVYCELCENRSTASHREWAIKKMNKQQKWQLCQCGGEQ